MNTSETPPGGWAYYQAQSGWTAPFPVGHTFTQQVQNIIKHRKANMALVVKHKLALDEATVGQELINYQIARGAIAAPPKPAPLATSVPQLSGAVQGAVAAVKKLAAGAAAILEWEDQNFPHVAPEVANERGSICVSCPKNQQGKGLTEYFTTAVSDLYNRKFQKQKDMNLTTQYDDQLRACAACHCLNRAQVHFPIATLESSDTIDRQNLYPSFCWKKKMSENYHP